MQQEAPLRCKTSKVHLCRYKDHKVKLVGQGVVTLRKVQLIGIPRLATVFIRTSAPPLTYTQLPILHLCGERGGNFHQSRFLILLQMLLWMIYK